VILDRDGKHLDLVSQADQPSCHHVFCLNVSRQVEFVDLFHDGVFCVQTINLEAFHQQFVEFYRVFLCPSSPAPFLLV